MRGITLFVAYPGEGGVNRILIFGGRLNGSFFMPFGAGGFFTLQARLSGFESRFSFCGALLFLANRADLRFLLTEVLHQRNIAWANPRAGAAFYAVRQIVRGGFIVLLAFAEPVQLLRQQIGRTGVGAGAAANAAFLFLRLAHLAGGRRQQAVGDLHHRDIQPRQGKAHQRAAHDHHWLGAGAEAGVVKQMAYRGTKARPDVARPRDRLAGKGDHALR